VKQEESSLHKVKQGKIVLAKLERNMEDEVTNTW